MPSLRARWTKTCLLTVCLTAICLLLPTLLPAQGASGRILGRVADPSGAVLSAAKITLTNEATGISRDANTNESGDYSFVDVAPGTYTVQFGLTGFKKNVQKGVIVDVNQVVTLNSTLQIGGSQETVEVTSEAPQVDTTSTQLGAVINDRSVNELPLNTRDTYQFLQLQPGVQSQLGSSGSLFAGSDDPGSVSVNGGRTRANNFSVNGGDANDQFVNTPTIEPTPDAVEEFRVITNTFDAEYGRNSGSVVNVITKSGGNGFHGDLYEYFRNTILDSRTYPDTVKPQLNQNQFGGTFGGPIKKDRTFFFLSYEARRIRDGQPGQLLNVPTGTPSVTAPTGEFSGDFSGQAPFAGGIQTGGFIANVLDGRSGCDAALGYTVAGLPMDPDGLTDWSSVFPTGVIPAPCQDPVAANLLQKFVPAANIGTGENQVVPVGTITRTSLLSASTTRSMIARTSPLITTSTTCAIFMPYDTFEAAGANVPGFGNLNDLRNQQWNFTHTWTINNALVNEAHFTYMREGQLGYIKAANDRRAYLHMQRSAAHNFALPALPTLRPSRVNSAPPRIWALRQACLQALPEFLTSTFPADASFGNNFEGFLPQVGNSFQWSDELTWVKGNHTFKFGVDIRRMRFDQYYYFDLNGEFTFDNSGPNAIVPGDGDHMPSSCWDWRMPTRRAPVSARTFAAPRHILSCRTVGRSSPTSL